MGRNHRRRAGRGIRRQVFKNKKALKRLNEQIEYKMIDLIRSTIVGDDDGNFLSLALIAVGDTASGRTGEKIYARRIMIRGHIHNDRGTPEDGTIRLLLIRKKQTGGVAVALQDVLRNENSGTSTLFAMRNPHNAHNLVVYYDETIAYDTSQHTNIPFKIIQKLAHTQQYNTTTGVETALESNGIYLMAIGDQATAANAPGVTFEARYSYTDL